LIFTQSNKIERRNQRFQIVKEVKLSLFSNDIFLLLLCLLGVTCGIILSRNDPKTPPKMLKHHKHFWQSSRTPNKCIKRVLFLYTNNEETKKKNRKIIPFTVFLKKTRNKFNEENERHFQ
jgi:hypothetical protein